MFPKDFFELFELSIFGNIKLELGPNDSLDLCNEYILAGFHLESHDRVIQKTKLGSKSEMTFWNRTYAMITFWLEQLAMRNQQCETLMASEEILKRLNHSDYDLVLADPSVPCGELLAAKELVKILILMPKIAHFISKMI